MAKFKQLYGQKYSDNNHFFAAYCKGVTCGFMFNKQDRELYLAPVYWFSNKYCRDLSICSFHKMTMINYLMKDGDGTRRILQIKH